MNKNINKPNQSNIEKNFLIVLLVLFVVVLSGAWGYAFKLRQAIMAKNAVAIVNSAALVDIERIRYLAESQVANSRSFFLLGSKVLFDKQKLDKQLLAEALSNFEKKYSLPQIPEIINKMGASQQLQQEFFDQAMEYREKQTESKIVGQFYQSKTVSLLKQVNEGLDDIAKIQNAELERVRSEAQSAAAGFEQQIPRGMAWLTGSLIFIFFGMAFLILRVLSDRKQQTAERDRLYSEAQKAILIRDEFVSAISHDLKEPMGHLHQIAEFLNDFSDSSSVRDSGELIKSTVNEIDKVVKNICDQKTAILDGLNLRLDQMAIDEILDDAQLMLQPLAKKNDVRLQFESANPPVLAFMDRERVIRALSHLIGNAIKFSPKHGKVIVKVRSDQQFVNISVSDSGPGIPENKLAEIFDHFWQARKTANEGAGVGLSVVKKIVEAHGGSVRATSGPGNGSTFSLSLPRRRPASAQLKKPAPVRYTTSPKHQMEI